MTISVVGIGKLGTPLIAALASKGFKVIGVDINPKLANKLGQGKTPLFEPGLSSLIRNNKKNIQATTDTIHAVLKSEVTFILVPTPSKRDNLFSSKFVEVVAKEIGRALKDKPKYHLVVLTSTVMPGTTEKVKAILEKFSSRKCGDDFGLCYNPEFIALGNALGGLLNPDFVLIGESDKKAGSVLQNLYSKFLDNKPSFARINPVNAEIAKIAVNTFVTTKISFANMLAEICEKLPGSNVDDVTSTLGLDSRIGNRYLKGGLGFGGPCFPRDNLSLIALAKKIGTSPTIIQATHTINLRQSIRLLAIIRKNSYKKGAIGILGLSYKPNTNIVEESQGLLLAQKLITKGPKINLYDPVALDNARIILGNKAQYMKSIKECIEKSDTIAITTDWPQFSRINPKWFGKNKKVLIDPWRIVKSRTLPKNVKYLPFGSSPVHKN